MFATVCNGVYFLEQVKTRDDLINGFKKELLTREEYAELKAHASKYVNTTFYALHDWNARMASDLLEVYKNVLTRMKEIENVK